MESRGKSGVKKAREMPTGPGLVLINCSTGLGRVGKQLLHSSLTLNQEILLHAEGELKHPPL